MGEITSIADRVRELRRRRGMTQEELAEAASVSVTVVRKIEQGGTARMETYHQLARALGVQTVMFVSASSPEPTEESVDDVVLADMRSAINPPRTLSGRPLHGTADADTADLVRLERALRSVAAAYHADRYDDLARLMPALVRSAHHHVAFYDGGQDRHEALRLRSDITGLAGRYLIQVRAHDLALVAMHTSLTDAVEIGHTPLAAAAISGQAHAMLRQGRLVEVEDLCAQTADEIEPRVSRATPDELAAWGWMLLRASAAASRNNRPGEAAEYLSTARAAAAPLTGEHQTVDYKTFGPTTVGLKGPENALIGGRPDEVLDLSRGLAPDGLHAEEWDRHRLDVAHAQVLKGDPDGATETLTEIRRAHPGWLRYQQLGRDTVRSILASRPRMPSEAQRSLAELMGVEG